jgi:aflatoxin B1 aldehyde reductase
LYRDRYFKPEIFECLQIIEPVAKKHELSLLEIALRWCVHHSKLQVKNGGRDGVIVGVSGFAQLEGNLRDLEKGPLAEEVVEALDKAWLVSKASTPTYWR